jgi:hypothetical protein
MHLPCDGTCADARGVRALLQLHSESVPRSAHQLLLAGTDLWGRQTDRQTVRE